MRDIPMPLQLPKAILTRATLKPLLWAAVVTCSYYTLIFCRLVPSGSSDRGIFVTVAERLLAGDRLYNDVFDNKDPLFYYLCAVGRYFGTPGEIILEHALVIGVASITLLILNHYFKTGFNLLCVSLCVPVIITPLWLYGFGYNTLPAILLIAGLYACAQRERFFSVGFLAGLTLFMKIIVTPIAICMALFLYAYPASAQKPTLRNLIRGVTGFIGAITLVLGVMFLRNEFSGYLQSLIDNFIYSTSHTVVTPSGAFRSLMRIRDILVLNEKFRYVLQFQIIFSCLLVISTFYIPVSRPLKQLFYVNIISPVLCVIILGLTGIWSHHASIFLIGSLLNFVTICVIIEHGLKFLSVSSAKKFGVSKFFKTYRIAMVLLVSPLLSGSNIFELIRTQSFFNESVKDYQTASQEVVLLMSQSQNRPVSFARLGFNEDLRGINLLKAYKLSCPDFQQYIFYTRERHERIYECVSRAENLMISPALSNLIFNNIALEQRFGEGPVEPFNDFIRRMRSTIAQDYDCTISGDKGPSVCRRQHHDAAPA